jgi:hypothetical protein
MQEGSWEREQIWAEARRPAAGPSSRRAIRIIEDLNPAVGRSWRVAARFAYRAATYAAAAPIARSVRRAVAAAIPGGD